MLMATKKKLIKCKYIICTDRVIKQENHVKYLGGFIGQSMIGEIMGKSVNKNVNGRLKFLYRKKYYMNNYIRKLVSFTIIQPFILCLQVLVPKPKFISEG